MTWILIGLVTVLTIAFVVYVFYLRPRAYGRYGSLDVPGDDAIDLPAGDIGIFYEDNQRWRYSDRPQVADGFSVLVSDPDGHRIDVNDPGTEIVWKASGKNRIPFGIVTIPTAGTYRVATQLGVELDMCRVTFGEPAAN